MLREQYVAGNEDRIKLLLSGDDPNRINRDLQYLGYVSQAQARMIESLRADLAAIEKNKAETQEAKEDLDQIAQEQREQKSLLEREKGRRASLVAQLSSRLSSQRKEAGNLERNEQRLGGLVDRLAKMIEEQRRAEIAAEKRRQQLAAEERARAEKLRQQRLKERQIAREKAEKAPPVKGATPRLDPADRIDDDENPNGSVAKNEPAPQAVPSSVYPASFTALRGQMHLPVEGELAARFGTNRGNGPAWKGLFIKTSEGAPVHAVAGGRVVFSEWLRGFGNLIIVDHGNQYMSIYGNNQALLKRAGDPVRAGETIASAGNSGGNEQSGLYFELRHQGRAFDPLGWMNSR
jgi:septal ring factor EnvC (AmiA/AmiB activator)